MEFTLVPDEKLEKDPRKLAYMYPKMPVGRYKDQTDAYYRLLGIRAAESVSAIFGGVLVPASCVHHKRRQPDRRVTLFGRSYYVLDLDDMTDLEIAKYDAYRGAANG